MGQDDWEVYFHRYLTPAASYWDSLEKEMEMIIGEITDEKYVRYTDMRDKWFRAVLDRDERPLRVSRKRFKLARDAREYRRAVLARLERLRACK